MTEDFMLPVFFNYYATNEQLSDLKIIYVCEEQNENVTSKLSEISRQIFADLLTEKLIAFVIHSEELMFKTIGKLFFTTLIVFIM